MAKFSVAPVLLGVAVLILCARARAAGTLDEDEAHGRLVSATIEAGDVAALTTLIEQAGGEIDRRHRWKGCATTMLAQAMGLGRLKIAAFLLAKGADADLPATVRHESAGSVVEVGAFTPLMFAARAGFPAGAELLIAKGADVNARGIGGLTALIVAAAYDSPDVARVLLKAKADREAQADDLKGLRGLPEVYKVSAGPAPAFVVSSAPGVTVITSNAPSTPRSVLDLPPARGATALWVAAAVGSEQMVRLLLEAGADRTAEASCAELRQVPAGEKRCSAARVAALLGFGPVAKLLGGGAQAAAVSVRPSDLWDIKPGDLRKKLWQIMNDKDVVALEAYLDAGLDVNGALGEKLSETPLTLACSASAAPAVRLLLERGAKPSDMVVAAAEIPLRQEDGRIRTAREQLPLRNPLTAAVTAGCEECVALLIDAGADVEATIWSGATPLVAAVELFNAKIVARLIAAGSPLEASISRVSADARAAAGCLKVGATPLWVAACNGREDMVRLLLEAGADPDAESSCADERRAEDREGRCTARRIAEIRGKAKVVALFDGEK